MLFNSPSFHDCVFILKRFYPCFHFLISLVLHEVLQIMCGIFGCIDWLRRSGDYQPVKIVFSSAKMRYLFPLGNTRKRRMSKLTNKA